jgi:hypothetical protein
VHDRVFEIWKFKIFKGLVVPIILKTVPAPVASVNATVGAAPLHVVTKVVAAPVEAPVDAEYPGVSAIGEVVTAQLAATVVDTPNVPTARAAVVAAALRAAIAQSAMKARVPCIVLLEA